MRTGVVLLLLLAGGSARGELWARVLDAETGRPVAGATVVIGRSDVMAVSDSAGNCLLVSRASAGLTATVSASGYIAAAVTPGAAALRAGTIELRLYSDQPRVVRGTVTDAGTKLPVAGATYGLSPSGEHGQAGADGTFVVAGLRTGALLLRIGHDGYPPESLRVTARGGETTDVSVALRDTADVGGLEGVVTDWQSGAPLSAARLEVEGTSLAASPDSAGRYHLGGVPTGSWRLLISCPGYVGGYADFRMMRSWVVEVSPRLRARSALPPPQR